MNQYIHKVQSDKAILWKNGGPLLVHLDMELTERCNNNCIHCYINLPADDFETRQRELSTGEIEEILKEAASLGCLTVRFTGGEPLLREDFEKLYLFARRLGLKVLLFTNATLINPRLVELFARIPPLVKVEITLYGMKRSSYEAVTRTPGSFEAAWHGINLMLGKNIPFAVKFALLPPNMREMDEFERWTSNIPDTDRRSPSYCLFFDLRCRRDSEEKNRIIRSLRLSPEDGLKVLAREKEEYLNGMVEFCSKFVAPQGDELFSCGSGTNSGCVDAYGYFQPCMLLRHPSVIYDLRGGSLKDALVRFFPEIRRMKATDSRYLARCARCFLKGLCDQCPAKSWAEYGTLDTPVAFFCGIAHAQARYLGLLEKDEMAWEIDDWRERIMRFTGQTAV